MMESLMVRVTGMVSREQIEIEDLHRTARFLWDEYRARLKSRARQAVLQYSEGDKVVTVGRGTRRLPVGAKGTVVKVSKSTLSVDFEQYGPWKVHPEFLKKVS